MYTCTLDLTKDGQNGSFSACVNQPLVSPPSLLSLGVPPVSRFPDASTSPSLWPSFDPENQDVIEFMVLFAPDDKEPLDWERDLDEVERYDWRSDFKSAMMAWVLSICGEKRCCLVFFSIHLQLHSF